MKKEAPQTNIKVRFATMLKLPYNHHYVVLCADFSIVIEKIVKFLSRLGLRVM